MELIERVCERLILDFAYFSDHREYESLGSLFTEAGIMVRPSGARLEGRDAIIAAYKATPADRITRHICTNIRITVDSVDRARGITYATVYSNSATPKVGEFEDTFERTREGWRIAIQSARFVIKE